MNDGKCRYRGILLPSAASNKERRKSSGKYSSLSQRCSTVSRKKFAYFSVTAAKQSNSLNQRQNNNRRISPGISHSQLGFVRSVNVLPQVFTYLGAELYSTPFRLIRVIFAVNKLLQGDMMPTCFMFQIFNVSLPR